MEIGVRIESENPLTGERRHTSSAYLTFVGLDDLGKPTEVPQVLPQTEDEKRRFLEGQARFEERRKNGRMLSWEDLREAIIEGAVKRLRPKVMTVAVMVMGLLPIMWSHGTGADVMKRIAAPMVGGILTSFVLELVVYPAIYAIWRERELRVGGAQFRSPTP